MDTNDVLLECDLVLKGGIASGVVYPKAITQLAQKYKFVNVGGTSAGAIAAGLVVAAEYARRKGSNRGFDALEELPSDISETLLSLFQPEPIHSNLFKSIIKYTASKKKCVAWFLTKNIFRIIRSWKELPNTRYGFCSGMTVKGNEALGLSDWLNIWIEKCAGRLSVDNRLPDIPLTFGMLEKENITLRTITTNLSQQSPVNLPNIGFTLAKKADLVRLLPENIVSYIESKQETFLSGISQDTLSNVNSDYLVLPQGANMPVLLGIRLSLSFPLLLSAFPLYKPDWSLRLCSVQQKKPRLCWYSDGGISSNFPIHLFDNPFPVRPTFGVSLNEFHSCRQEKDQSGDKGSNRVYLPMDAGKGMAVSLNDVKGLLGFFMAIFNSAQNWQDATQTYLPGYRERIVRIALKDDEGGLNLSMPPEVIQKLTDIGESAGKVIRQEFEFDEHRWRRILGTYAAIEIALEEIESSYFHGKPESTDNFLKRYESALNNGNNLVGSYKPRDLAEFRKMKDRLDQLMKLAVVIKNDPIRNRWGTGNMPKPSGVLKISPEKFSQ